MADVELIKKWRATSANLERARRMLPSPLRENAGEVPGSDLAKLAAYQEYLDNNELELALDELEALGELNNCRGGYWRNLERAAQIMGLHARSTTFRRRFDESLDNCTPPDATI